MWFNQSTPFKKKNITTAKWWKWSSKSFWFITTQDLNLRRSWGLHKGCTDAEYWGLEAASWEDIVFIKFPMPLGIQKMPMIFSILKKKLKTKNKHLYAAFIAISKQLSILGVIYKHRALLFLNQTQQHPKLERPHLLPGSEHYLYLWPSGSYESPSPSRRLWDLALQMGLSTLFALKTKKGLHFFFNIGCFTQKRQDLVFCFVSSKHILCWAKDNEPYPWLFAKCRVKAFFLYVVKTRQWVSEKKILMKWLLDVLFHCSYKHLS